MNLILIEKKVSSSAYSARTWDYEDAFRYIFNINEKILEAGFFVHYLNGSYIKSVIELPISFGCPIRCKHCASGAIPFARQLTNSEIVSMFSYISAENNLYNKEKVLITYSGIGEGALQKENLRLASTEIHKKHPGTYFNFSTVGFDPSFVDYCEEISNVIPLNYIQVSYLHHDNTTLSSLITDAKKLGFNFANLIDKIYQTKSKHVRFNYVLMAGFNDQLVDWNRFIEISQIVKDQIIVRVSKLNDTQTSTNNRLSSVSTETMCQLRDLLIMNGYTSHIFFPENDNTMNCGQLSWEYISVSGNR